MCPMRAGYVAQDPASSDISAVGRRALGFHVRARLRLALCTVWTRTRSPPRWSRTRPTCRVWPSQWACSGLHQPRRRGAAQPGQRDRTEVVYVQNAPMRRPSPGHRYNIWRGSTGPARQRRRKTLATNGHQTEIFRAMTACATGQGRDMWIGNVTKEQANGQSALRIGWHGDAGRHVRECAHLAIMQTPVSSWPWQMSIKGV